MAGTRDLFIQLPVDGAGKKVDGFYYTQTGATVYAPTQVLVDQDGNTVDTLAADASGTTNGLSVSMMATNFVHSTANSTSVQLGSGATFTGTIESVYNQQAISILTYPGSVALAGTLVINQYIDLAGTQKISSWSIAVPASTSTSRCFVANGNYFNLSYTNGAGTTIGFAIDTAFGILPAVTNLGNAPTSLNEVSGTALTLAAKAVQPAVALPTQDLKDSGRVSAMFTASVASTATTETLIGINKSLGLAATSSTASNAITSGKRFRVQALVASVRNSTGTVASNVTLRIRAAVAGATTASSPIQFQSTVPLPASAVAVVFPVGMIADGFEIDSNAGTNTWGVTITHPQWATGTQVATFDIAIMGYEF